MKRILRNTLIHTLTLYLAIEYIPGVEFNGGYAALLAAGAGLTILMMLVRPILKILMLPINLITAGIFSGFINIAIIYLLTIFFEPLSIHGWTFAKFEYQGFTIPKLDISAFWTYILVSFIISTAVSLIIWLCE